ncbi:hypothetical protein CHS0354_035448 [Potamilus streckersoni]|uniref:Uncharacterized protein n=1 Tax=Potamilus streckersoni TaxID=2493646 RepID=A0AAE0WBF0_9BIVA|nr:hypothetical protein CHS0354_035448 [Potamilus streckersoni]
MTETRRKEEDRLKKLREEVLANSKLTQMCEQGEEANDRFGKLLYEEEEKVTKDTAGYNVGVVARRALADTSHNICMFLPLNSFFDVCRDIHNIFRGVKHKLVLERDSPDQYMHRIGRAEALADEQLNKT